jgi:[acyl-carrier-protein] S-malonyltransferase
MDMLPALVTKLAENQTQIAALEKALTDAKALINATDKKAAVEKACEVLKAMGAKRALNLPVSAPFHSSLMKPAAEKLKEKLATTSFAAAQIPLINNIDVTVEADADRIRDALYRQAFGPVRWVECVQAIKAKGISTVVECGPGKVLAGMVKRIDADMTGLALFDPVTLAEVKGALV